MRVGDGRRVDVLAAHLELRALHGLVNVETRDRHRVVGQLGIARAGDDADLLAVGPDLVAEIGRAVGIDQQAEDLEAFLALQAGMFLGAAEAGLAGADGEVEAEFPQAVAGRLVGEGIHLRIVVGVEQQVAFDAQHVENAEAARG